MLSQTFFVKVANNLQAKVPLHPGCIYTFKPVTEAGPYDERNKSYLQLVENTVVPPGDNGIFRAIASRGVVTIQRDEYTPVALNSFIDRCDPNADVSYGPSGRPFPFEKVTPEPTKNPRHPYALCLKKHEAEAHYFYPGARVELDHIVNVVAAEAAAQKAADDAAAAAAQKAATEAAKRAADAERRVRAEAARQAEEEAKQLAEAEKAKQARRAKRRVRADEAARQADEEAKPRGTSDQADDDDEQFVDARGVSVNDLEVSYHAIVIEHALRPMNVAALKAALMAYDSLVDSVAADTDPAINKFVTDHAYGYETVLVSSNEVGGLRTRLLSTYASGIPASTALSSLGEGTETATYDRLRMMLFMKSQNKQSANQTATLVGKMLDSETAQKLYGGAWIADTKSVLTEYAKMTIDKKGRARSTMGEAFAEAGLTAPETEISVILPPPGAAQ
jgi:hypothetical protein